MKKLTPKQERFINEYLIDLNGAQAAIRAGYSKKTAKVIAAENLTKPYIQQAIEKKQKKLRNKIEVTQERVLKELARLAFNDVRKFWDEKGNLKDIKDLDDDAAAAIAGMDIEDIYEGAGQDRIYAGKVRKVKLSNKISALDMLSKHLGLYEVDNEQKGPSVITVIYDKPKPKP